MPATKREQRSGVAELQAPKVRPLQEVDVAELPRLDMGEKELNRVLGGGRCQAGLSCWAASRHRQVHFDAQVALAVGSSGVKVLYISGEESAEQVRMRANRLGPSRRQF